MFANAVELARIIDHTMLAPIAQPEHIDILCDEAAHYSFYSVCVNPCYVSRAAERLRESGVKICTVIDFPLGSSTTPSKVMEGVEAVKNGATELDVVMNVGMFKSRDYESVARQLKDFILLTPGVVHKVIIETCYLSAAEKAGASRLAAEVGAEFVKSSTGFGPDGANPADIRLMKEAVIGKAKIKASGGIRDLDSLVEMVESGAERIGTSRGVDIVREFISRQAAKGLGEA